VALDREIRRCSVCVLDDSVYTLEFDEAGQCDACRRAALRLPQEWYPGPEGRTKLENLTKLLKQNGQGRPYDAMIGLSGGIDSAYLAHFAVRDLGLRVLAIHVDAGWNSNAAVQNIERMVRGLDIDLITHVVEWREMADLQLSFMKAGVFNQDIPQDHAFFSTLFRTANRLKINFFLSGVNFSSECISPRLDGVSYHDGIHINGIQKLFGTHKLRAYRTMKLVEYAYLTKVLKRPKIVTPLNYVDYDKEAARRVLEENYGWVEYGEKHSESRFTKFYQDIYLPRKFRFDKRALHLSSRIVSGQISREAAVEELATPISNPESVRKDIRFVAKKLKLSVEELERLIDAPPVSHLNYPNSKWIYRLFFSIRSKITGALAPS
jgi:N-acetyl sugar amidotransferase